MRSPQADDRRQPIRYRLGSDDGGATWRVLAPNERAGLCHVTLGAPAGWAGDWSEPRSLREAIEQARADRARLRSG